MLDKIDFSLPDMGKADYKAERDALVSELVVLQQQARAAGAGLVVLFEGWNGAGKGSRISDIMFNLDARATSVHVTGDVDVATACDFAHERGNDMGGFFPLMQEFWSAMGPRGAITFFDRGWYLASAQRVLISAFGDLKVPKKYAKKGADVLTLLDDEHLRRARACAGKCLASVRDFERQLYDDGYEVVKFFIHITEEEQRARLDALRRDPAMSWRVSDERYARIGNYPQARFVYDAMLDRTDFGFAPWCVVNGQNKRAANIEILRALVGALKRVIARHEAPSGQGADEPVPAGESGQGGAGERAAAAPDFAHLARIQSAFAPKTSAFPQVKDTPQLCAAGEFPTMDPAEYKDTLKELQRRLFRLESLMYRKRIPLMVMYEGWDAAGKGGNIKRVAQALDARAYTIFPSPAPTPPELAHPHLWRYWTRLPKAGHVGLYDRSWYGRVLVERVEGFAAPEAWARAYDEINAFERDLVEWGAVLVKFWVDVSQGEQLARFQARAADPAKQWKITDEDWRNREKYPLYKAAIEDMFRLTSTTYAPWCVLESDDKRFARVKALRTIIDALEAAGVTE